MISRRIILGAGTALFLAVAAPLSAQQPTEQPTQQPTQQPTLQHSDSAGHSVGKTDGESKSQTGKTDGESKSQTQSGVTDSSGTSTLGPNIRKATPDANAAVTAKGDTLKALGRKDSTETR